MKQVRIYDRATEKDITTYVTLKVGKGGYFHVIEKAFNEDITEHIYFVIG